MKRTEKYSLQVLIWHKTNAKRMNKRQYISDLEYCLKITEGQQGNDINEYLSKLYQSGMNNKENALYHHQTCKPEVLVKKHILFSSNENDLILDTFSGSGTTCACAKALNRHYLGFEINEEYYKSSLDRLNGVVRDGKSEQTTLFD